MQCRLALHHCGKEINPSNNTINTITSSFEFSKYHPCAHVPFCAQAWTLSRTFYPHPKNYVVFLLYMCVCVMTINDSCRYGMLTYLYRPSRILKPCCFIYSGECHCAQLTKKEEGNATTARFEFELLYIVILCSILSLARYCTALSMWSLFQY